MRGGSRSVSDPPRTPVTALPTVIAKAIVPTPWAPPNDTAEAAFRVVDTSSAAVEIGSAMAMSA